MSASPHTNGGELLSELRLPDFRDYAVAVPGPGATTSEAARVAGTYLRDVVAMNPDNFRIFGPDETASNRLGAVFDVTNRQWLAPIYPLPLPHRWVGLIASEDGVAVMTELLGSRHPENRRFAADYLGDSAVIVPD